MVFFHHFEFRFKAGDFICSRKKRKKRTETETGGLVSEQCVQDDLTENDQHLKLTRFSDRSCGRRDVAPQECNTS